MSKTRVPSHIKMFMGFAGCYIPCHENSVEQYSVTLILVLVGCKPRSHYQLLSLQYMRRH